MVVLRKQVRRWMIKIADSVIRARMTFSRTIVRVAELNSSVSPGQQPSRHFSILVLNTRLTTVLPPENGEQQGDVTRSMN